LAQSHLSYFDFFCLAVGFISNSVGTAQLRVPRARARKPAGPAPRKTGLHGQGAPTNPTERSENDQPVPRRVTQRDFFSSSRGSCKGAKTLQGPLRDRSTASKRTAAGSDLYLSRATTRGGECGSVPSIAGSNAVKITCAPCHMGALSSTRVVLGLPGTRICTERRNKIGHHGLFFLVVALAFPGVPRDVLTFRGGPALELWGKYSIGFSM